MRKIAYLALDVHVSHCVVGDMDSNGNFRGTQKFATSEQNIIQASAVNLAILTGPINA
jgi:hypothetical protein